MTSHTITPLVPASQMVCVELIRQLTAGVRVGTLLPDPAPRAYVVVARHGGTMAGPITDRALISITVYADNQYAAEALCGSIRQALNDQSWWGRTIRGHMVRSWQEAAGPSRIPNPQRAGLYCFQFAGQLAVSTLHAT